MTVEPAGRLYQALVETKKATSVRTWNFATCTIRARSSSSRRCRSASRSTPARDAMLATLDDVAERADHRSRSRARARASALKDFDQTVNDPQAFGVALSECDRARRLALVLPAARPLAQAHAGRRAARRDSTSSSRRTCTLGKFVPDAKPDRAPAPPAVDVAALVKDYKGDAAVAAGETFDPTPANLEARTQRFTLANGMKVALLPKKTRGETVRFSLRMRFGDEKSLFGTAPAGALAGAMLTRGTREARRGRRSRTRSTRCARRSRFGGSRRRRRASRRDGAREHLPDTLQARRRGAARRRRSTRPSSTSSKRAQLDVARASRTDPQAIARPRVQPARQSYPAGDVRDDADVRRADRRDLRAAKLDDVQARSTRSSTARATPSSRSSATSIPPRCARSPSSCSATGRARPPYARVPDPFIATRPVRETIETPDKANAVLVGGMAIPMSDRSSRLRGDARRRAHPRRRRRVAHVRGHPPADGAVVRRRHLPRDGPARRQLDARPLRDLRAAERRRRCAPRSPSR